MNKQRIEEIIGNAFIVDYATLIENKLTYKCKIAVKCTKCESQTILTIEAIAKCKKENRIPYKCSSCKMSEIKSTPEAREKCSKSSKMLWNDPIKSQALLDKLTIVNSTDERRQKASIKFKKMYQEDPIYRERLLNASDKAHNDPEAIAFRHERLMEVASDPLLREMHRANSRLLWQDPDYRKKVLGEIQANSNNSISTKITELLSRASKSNKPYKLLAEDIWDCYNKQRAECALSGILLTHGTHDYSTMSIDRIDSSKGYFKNNIQLVCQFVNYGKSVCSNESVKTLINKIGKTYTPNLLKDAILIRHLSNNKAYKTLGNFIIKLYKRQNGMCALSGIPMECKTGAMALSVDRINSKKGYIDGNIQLVCRFFNLGKRHYSDSKTREFIQQIRINSNAPSLKSRLDRAFE